MFENRGKAGRDSGPPRIEAPELDGTTSLLSSLLPSQALIRRALIFGTVAIAGYVAVWQLFFGPLQQTSEKRVVESKPVVQAAVDVPKTATISAPAPAPTPTPAAVPVAAPVAAADVRPSPPPVATQAEPAPPAVEAAAAPLTSDEIRELQSKLLAVGFDAGPIDGLMGPLTEAAVRRYARARNLAKADATRELLVQLRLEPPRQ